VARDLLQALLENLQDEFVVREDLFPRAVYHGVSMDSFKYHFRARNVLPLYALRAATLEAAVSGVAARRLLPPWRPHAVLA
jgi:hypothetical protein